LRVYKLSGYNNFNGSLWVLAPFHHNSFRVRVLDQPVFLCKILLFHLSLIDAFLLLLFLPLKGVHENHKQLFFYSRLSGDSIDIWHWYQWNHH